MTLEGGVRWAHVYVNGKKQRKTAPNKYPLPPGTYEVRVENPPAGLSFKKKVTVAGGKSVTVKAKPN